MERGGLQMDMLYLELKINLGKAQNMKKLSK